MYPKINDFVYIQIASGDEKESLKEFKSRISDNEEEAFLIEMPLESGKNRYKKLYVGDELSIYFISEGGIKNYFNTYVLGFSNDSVPQVRIRKPDPNSISQIQRRNFLRVVAKLELAIKLKNNTRFIAFTEDVGGGGVSFYNENKSSITEGELMDCWLLVPYKNGTVEHVPFEAEVVRSKKLESGNELIMLKFVRITDFERQKLIRYCFERQFDFKNR